jgi:prenyltransferase beta subunit
MKRLMGLVALLVLPAVCFAQTPEQKKETIAYLQKLQNADGGFAAMPGGKSSLRATSSALRALKYFGGDAPNRAKSADFVKSCHDKATGGFADAPGGTPDVAISAVGIMAVVELRMPVETYQAGVIKYLDDNVKTFEDIRIAVAGLEAIGKTSPQQVQWTLSVRKMANTDGTFGKGDGQARDTGGATVALLRMGVLLTAPQTNGVLKALNAGQRTDGGFGKADAAGSDLETSYRVMRCYHMLDSKPSNAAKLREFVAKCRNADGGYGVTPGQPSAVGSTYFASIILRWLDEK